MLLPKTVLEILVETGDDTFVLNGTEYYTNGDELFGVAYMGETMWGNVETNEWESQVMGLTIRKDGDEFMAQVGNGRGPIDTYQIKDLLCMLNLIKADHPYLTAGDFNKAIREIS